MNKIEFLVQGSECEPYKVHFQKTGTNLTASCTCKAAVNGMSCKHRLRILNGQNQDIVSSNLNQVQDVLNWFKDSTLEKKISEIEKKERQLELLKKEVQSLKKDIASFMVNAA